MRAEVLLVDRDEARLQAERRVELGRRGRGYLEDVGLVNVEGGVGGQRADDLLAGGGGDSFVDERERLGGVGGVVERRVRPHRARQEIDRDPLAQPVEGDKEPRARHAERDERLEARLRAVLGQPVHDLADLRHAVQVEVGREQPRRRLRRARLAVHLHHALVVLVHDGGDALERAPVGGGDGRVGVVNPPRELGGGKRLAGAVEVHAVGAVLGEGAHARHGLLQPAVGVALVEDAEGDPARQRRELVGDARGARHEVHLHGLALPLRRHPHARRVDAARDQRVEARLAAPAREQLHDQADVVRRVEVEVLAELLRGRVGRRLAHDLERDVGVALQDGRDLVERVLVLLEQPPLEVLDAPRLRQPELGRLRLRVGRAVEVHLILGHEARDGRLRRRELPLGVAALHLRVQVELHAPRRPVDRDRDRGRAGADRDLRRRRERADRRAHLDYVSLVEVEEVGAGQAHLPVVDCRLEHGQVEQLVTDHDGHAARDGEHARPVGRVGVRVDEAHHQVARRPRQVDGHLLGQLRRRPHHKVLDLRLEAHDCETVERARHELGLQPARASLEGGAQPVARRAELDQRLDARDRPVAREVRHERVHVALLVQLVVVGQRRGGDRGLARLAEHLDEDSGEGADHLGDLP